MNDKFDELAKGLAQSDTRRWALKKFGLGFPFLTRTFLCLAVAAQFAVQTHASNFRLGPLIQVSRTRTRWLAAARASDLMAI
jgi:hypothetical protein